MVALAILETPEHCRYEVGGMLCNIALGIADLETHAKERIADVPSYYC